MVLLKQLQRPQLLKTQRQNLDVLKLQNFNLDRSLGMWNDAFALAVCRVSDSYPFSGMYCSCSIHWLHRSGPGLLVPPIFCESAKAGQCVHHPRRKGWLWKCLEDCNHDDKTVWWFWWLFKTSLVSNLRVTGDCHGQLFHHHVNHIVMSAIHHIN